MSAGNITNVRAIAGFGNCGPMQSAGSMYVLQFGGGGGGRALHYSTCLNFTCKLYMMLSDVRLRAYKYVDLTLNCALQALFYVWCGLWAAAIAGCSYCGPIQSAGAMNFSIRDLHNLMHFYMQTSSDALLSEWAGLRLYTVDHVNFQA